VISDKELNYRLSLHTAHCIKEESLATQSHTNITLNSTPDDFMSIKQFVAKEGRLPMRAAKSGLTCCACHTSKASHPQKAACGHVCCSRCWVDRFKVLLLYGVCYLLFYHGFRMLTRVVPVVVEGYTG